ncbi:MAG: hypothetical protein ABI589_02575 [Burkholderiales bacterium]
MSDALFAQASIQFRVTVGAEDAPALFNALHSIKIARRRVHRFRELAIKGLLLEQLGVQALAPPASGQVKADRQQLPEPLSHRTSVSVSDQLSWGDE